MLLFIWHVTPCTTHHDCVNYSLLAESVKALLGKHVKILLKNVVKLETKQDKQENRVLVSNLCLFLPFSFVLWFVCVSWDKSLSFSVQGIFAMSPLSLIGQSTHKSKFQLCTSFCFLIPCDVAVTLKFYSFVDRLPFSLPRDNGYRIKKSQSIMFDCGGTILQFYYNQRRWGYHGSGRYDRGLTHGNSQYFSYGTVKVCSIHLEWS